jgi:3-hydroxyisobutyrate dehydrogenase
MSAPTRIGLIGTGIMGSRFARRLVDHGFELILQNRTRARAQALAGPSVEIVDTPAEVGRKAKIILSSLANDDAVRSTFLGPAGVLAHASPGSIVLEMSTVSPDTSRRVNVSGLQRRIEVLDVAVSGSTVAAERGELTLLIGGDEGILPFVDSILRAIATQWFYMGPSGSGTQTKLVVNALLGIGMQAIAEAAAFGQKMGLRRDRLLDVLSRTAVVAPAFKTKLSRISANDFSPQFPLRLMNKDFRLVLEKASSLGVLMPATAASYGINQEESARENEEDFSAVVRRMEELSRPS